MAEHLVREGIGNAFRRTEAVVKQQFLRPNNNNSYYLTLVKRRWI